MYTRVFADIILFILVYTAPWWLALVVGLVLLFYFDRYVEFIIFAFVLDTVFNTRLNVHIFYSATLVTFVIYVISELMKRRLTLYSD
jgi:hypothetical protein